jgi:hypothetical protein
VPGQMGVSAPRRTATTLPGGDCGSRWLQRIRQEPPRGSAGLGRGLSVVIRGDDFYRVMDEDQRTGPGPRGRDRSVCRLERIRDQALVPLRSGVPARFRRYDWRTGGLELQTIDTTCGSDRDRRSTPAAPNWRTCSTSLCSFIRVGRSDNNVWQLAARTTTMGCALECGRAAELHPGAPT